MDDLVVDLLGLDAPAIEHGVWIDIVRRLKSPSGRVDIGVVGKYIELQDAYKSFHESLTTQALPMIVRLILCVSMRRPWNSLKV